MPTTHRRDPADVIEDLEFLDSTGVGANDAAKRTDFPNAHAMEKWLERHDRRDLWLRFKHRDPEGAHPSGSDRSKVASVTSIDPIAAVLDAAAKSKSARTRNRAEKVRGLVEALRSDVAMEREDDKRRELARREVERLERELAEARARLKGGSARSASINVGPSIPAADLPAWAKRNGIECPPMGRVPAAVREAYARETEAAEVTA